MSNNLIEVRNLVKHFEVSKSVFSRNKKIVKAVDGISFDINESPKNRKMRAIKNLSETGVGGEKEAAIEKLKQMGGPQLPLAMGNPLYQMGNMAGVYGPVPFS